MPILAISNAKNNQTSLHKKTTQLGIHLVYDSSVNLVDMKMIQPASELEPNIIQFVWFMTNYAHTLQ